MLSELEVQYSELIIVPVQSNVNKITLPQNLEVIEGGRIIAIEAYSVTQQGTTPTLLPVVNVTAFNNSFLTIKNKESGSEDYHQVPLTDLIRNQNSGIMERIKSLKADFSQSYIEIGNPATLVIGEAYLFRVIYEKDAIGCPK
jgi:hypothetical protein